MTDTLEAVDANGYLHAIARADRHGGAPGYVCTCGTWVPRGAWWTHLEELGPTTEPPLLPMIDDQTRARAVAASRIAASMHNTAREDHDGFVVCNCGMPFPAWDDWGDHYADATVAAALNEISTR